MRLRDVLAGVRRCRFEELFPARRRPVGVAGPAGTGVGRMATQDALLDHFRCKGEHAYTDARIINYP